MEIGGTQYLLPLVNKEKVYELKDIAKAIQIEPVFLAGAGAGPYPFIGVNCEVCGTEMKTNVTLQVLRE